jgi:hypothetical protein
MTRVFLCGSYLSYIPRKETMPSSKTYRRPRPPIAESLSPGLLAPALAAALVTSSLPFVIRSGDMHDPRVTRTYRRDRMGKMRALGLNTLCTCVFWNLHEPEPGNLDLAEYIRTAQGEGFWLLPPPAHTSAPSGISAVSSHGCPPAICACAAPTLHSWPAGIRNQWMLKRRRDFLARPRNPAPSPSRALCDRQSRECGCILRP